VGRREKVIKKNNEDWRLSSIWGWKKILLWRLMSSAGDKSEKEEEKEVRRRKRKEERRVEKKKRPKKKKGGPKWYGFGEWESQRRIYVIKHNMWIHQERGEEGDSDMVSNYLITGWIDCLHIAYHLLVKERVSLSAWKVGYSAIPITIYLLVVFEDGKWACIS